MAAHQPPPAADRRLAWIDIETTGLDPAVDLILEIGIIITDGDLSTLAEFAVVVHHADDLVSERMAGADLQWANLGMHTANGLLSDVSNSACRLWVAERRALEFVRAHTEVRTAPMAGASVHFDRAFMARHCRELHDHFHYRNLDVSTMMQLVDAWRPDVESDRPRKRNIHRALADLEDTIRLLQFYRHRIFAR